MIGSSTPLLENNGMRVLDHHDDLCEAYIRALGSTPVPQMLKEAAWVERDALLDRDFALILLDDDGKSHRKYASYDRGNTDLSIFYLLTQPHGLPASAVKVAAVNLLKAAEGFGTYIPKELRKIAGAPFFSKEMIDDRRVHMKQANVGTAAAAGAAHGAASALGHGASKVKLPVAAPKPVTGLNPSALAQEQAMHAAYSGHPGAGSAYMPSASPSKAPAPAPKPAAAAPPAAKPAASKAPAPTPAAPAPTTGAAPAADVSHGGNVPGAAPTAHPAAAPPPAAPSPSSAPVVTPTAGAAAAPAPPMVPAAPAASAATPPMTGGAGNQRPMDPSSMHAGIPAEERMNILKQRLTASRTARGQAPVGAPDPGGVAGPAAEARVKNQIAAEQQARQMPGNTPTPMSAEEAAAQGAGFSRDEVMAYQNMTQMQRMLASKPKPKSAPKNAPAAAPEAQQGVNWMPYAAATGVGAIGATMLANKQSDAPNIFDALQVLQARWADLDPYDRHDLAVEATKEAAAIGAEVPDHIFRYSGETLSPRFGDYMRVRQQYAGDTEVFEAYGRLAKVAEAIEPEELVETLFRLDDMAGLCHRYGEKIADPFLCVFDRVKEAGWSWRNGTHYVTEDDLQNFAASPSKGSMRDIFEDSFVDSFRKSPVEFFKKQTVDVQVILARMASQSGVHNTGGMSSHA